jgi:hypothetical protein
MRVETCLLQHPDNTFTQIPCQELYSAALKPWARAKTLFANVLIGCPTLGYKIPGPSSFFFGDSV